MVNLLIMLLSIFFLSGCSSQVIPQESIPETIPQVSVMEASVMETTAPVQEETDPVAEILSSMPLEDWVGQLFLVGVDRSQVLDQIEKYNLGGLLLFSGDFQDEDKDSMAKKLAGYQDTSQVPLLIAVDEEGGTVVRISTFSAFRDKRFSSPRVLYDQGRMEWVRAEENEKCRLLQALGINVNLGPVCDITTDPYAFMYKRSLGQDAQITGSYVSDMVTLKQSYGIGSSLKHFPGYGNNEDTHTGIVRDRRSLASLEAQDLVPFQAGIDAGCGAVMVSHTIVEALDPDMPASLSPAVHRYLRETMGFEGVILTDDLNMKAIANRYGAGEAAVLAVLAGNDLLCATSFTEQYEAVLAAVLEGRIDYDTLRSAVTRVLEWKLQLGLIE